MHWACLVFIARCTHGLRPVRAISLDITGTLITHKGSVVQHYVDAAVWAQLDDPPSVEEMKPAFKQAYKERCLASPCFGGAEGVSGRTWWRQTAQRIMALTGRSYKEDDFDRWFRRVYQHFGSPQGYEVLPDAATFLDKIPDAYVLGICSNTPNRHSASVLPMLGIHERFKFFACDVVSRHAIDAMRVPSRHRRDACSVTPSTRRVLAQVLAGRRPRETGSGNIRGGVSAGGVRIA